MPVLRTENIHNVVCKFYDGGVVKVGTAGDRFTIRVPAEEEPWFATRLRAELIRRELATAEEPPMDEAGEAAMAASVAAKAHAADLQAASKIVKAAAAVEAKAAARMAGAEQDVMKAEHKRELAKMQGEHEIKMADMKAKVARLVPLASQLARVEPKAAALQTKLDAFMRAARVRERK